MSSDPAAVIEVAQTFLFVPASRPDRFTKAHSAGVDVVVLDLEDAVSSADKDDARRNAQAWLGAGNTAMVRINGVGTPWHADDVRMVAQFAAAIMLPKSEGSESITGILAATPGTVVVPLIESAAGFMALSEISLTASVVRLAFGSIDLATQLGVDPDDRDALLFARSALVVASAAAGLASPIDGVTMNFSDAQKVASDTSYARRLGMLAKLCIHPAQVGPIHEAFAPSPQDVAWADRVLEAVADDGSAVAVDGAMVDLPVIRRAQQILAAVGNRHGNLGRC